MNKKTLVKIGLTIDAPLVSPDGVVAEITIGEEENRRVVNFDETDHSFLTMCNRDVKVGAMG